MEKDTFIKQNEKYKNQLSNLIEKSELVRLYLTSLETSGFKKGFVFGGLFVLLIVMFLKILM